VAAALTRDVLGAVEQPPAATWGDLHEVMMHP
jgi:hypothetical protein